MATTHRFLPTDGQFYPGLPDRDLTTDDAVDPAAVGRAIREGIFEIVDPAAEETDAPTEKPLARMSKSELQAIAAELELDTSGTNRELIDRIGVARA